MFPAVSPSPSRPLLVEKLVDVVFEYAPVENAKDSCVVVMLNACQVRVEKSCLFIIFVEVLVKVVLNVFLVEESLLLCCVVVVVVLW